MAEDNEKMDKIEILSDKFDKFIEQYDKDMRGDMNSDNGGRRGVIENIRDLRKNQELIEEKVAKVNEMEDQVKKNTAFRKNVQRVMWIVVTIVLGVIVYAAISGIAQSIVANGIK